METVQWCYHHNIYATMDTGKAINQAGKCQSINLLHNQYATKLSGK